MRQPRDWSRRSVSRRGVLGAGAGALATALGTGGLATALGTGGLVTALGTGAVTAEEETGAVTGEETDGTSVSEDPDIETLREKWFLTFDGEDVPFPPSTRTAGSDLADYVSADVTPLYDGRTFMEQWHASLTEMTEEFPEDSSVYHQTLRLGQVPLLGGQHPETAADDVIEEAHDAGVDVSILVSGDLGDIWDVRRVVDDLDIDTVVVDYRHPAGGSNHQKVSIFDSPAETYAMVGSADLYHGRWGDPPFEPDNPDRPAQGPSHEVVLKLTGPVVREIHRTHLARWNDESRNREDAFHGETPPMLDEEPIEPDDEGGTMEVQILHTYGIAPSRGYSWSETGEFTAWAGYLNAIQQASEYIYIEDQFFIPHAQPPRFRRPGVYQEMDVFYQLGQALERGVDVLVTTTMVQDGYAQLFDEQRMVGIEYLDRVAADAPGDFTVAYLWNGRRWVYVHSKMMLVDDEVSFVGTMNTGRRSMSHDGEIQLAIIDAENEFTRDLRTSIWQDFLGYSDQEAAQELWDTQTGVETFKQGVAHEEGLLRPFERYAPPTFTPFEREMMNTAYDPYGGPTIEGGIPAIADGFGPPQDHTRDGLLEDVDGDGSVGVADVQALFDNLHSPVVQDNADRFDFSGTGGEVSVFDVQALFNRVRE